MGVYSVGVYCEELERAKERTRYIYRERERKSVCVRERERERRKGRESKQAREFMNNATDCFPRGRLPLPISVASSSSSSSSAQHLSRSMAPSWESFGMAAHIAITLWVHKGTSE
jgi:hypothetical protein